MATIVRFIGCVSLMIAGTIPVLAQGSLGNQSGSSILKVQRPDISLKSMSLLDPSRFSMRQESVVSYSSSGMSGGNLLGMYINTMEYKFNMPLTMRMKVAYQSNMGSMLGSKSLNGREGMETGNLFIPSFDLIYQPWKNTFLSFHYRDFSGLQQNGAYGFSANPYSRYARYYDPFGLYR